MIINIDELRKEAEYVQKQMENINCLCRDHRSRVINLLSSNEIDQPTRLELFKIIRMTDVNLEDEWEEREN